MSNKGFTLMELLSVIVIMGILTAISIPLIINIQNQNGNNNFDYYMGMVKEATSLYEDTYMPNFDESINCIKLDYQKLVQTELLKEENFKCTGTILGLKTNNKGFKYEYFLDCKDSKNHVMSNESHNLPPLTCKVLN